MSSYSYQFPEVSQYSGQQTGFFESHSHRLDSEPSSRFSSGSRETSTGSYRALEEDFRRTVEKLNTAERELAIQKALNAQMQVQLDRSMTALGMSRTLVPAQLNSPVSIKPSRLDKEDPDGPPTLPPALDELDPDDYPNTQYWTQSSWIEYKKKQANQGYGVFGLAFLCNAEGDRVSRDRLDAMTKRAKQLWNTLYRHRQDPTTWGKKGEFVADFFSRHMRNSFMEFGLCEGNWKADAFAIVRYPDWASKVRTTGAILRKKPSKGKRKHEDDSEEKPAPKTKRQKVKAVPPPVDATIIHVDDDEDMYADPPPPSLGPTTSTSTSVPASLTTTDSPTSAGSSPSVGSVPIIIHTTLSQDTDQTTISTRSADSTSSLPPTISEVSSPASAVGVQDPNAHLTSARKKATNSTQQPEPGANAASSETLQVSHQADEVPRRSRRQIDPLRNLVVPPPPEQVPSIEQPLALPAPPKATTKRPTKADEKEFSVGKGLSARNLYGAEYKKSHPHVTVGEYRVVWDGIDEAIRKKFEQLCKTQKAERKADAAREKADAAREKAAIVVGGETCMSDT